MLVYNKRICNLWLPSDKYFCYAVPMGLFPLIIETIRGRYPVPLSLLPPQTGVCNLCCKEVFLSWVSSPLDLFKMPCTWVSAEDASDGCAFLLMTFPGYLAIAAQLGLGMQVLHRVLLLKMHCREFQQPHPHQLCKLPWSPTRGLANRAIKNNNKISGTCSSSKVAPQVSNLFSPGEVQCTAKECSQ